MAKTYKRSVFVGPNQIRIDELPILEPGPHQALVKVHACAICTWEQRVYSGIDKMYPMAGGHEVSGELVSVGKYFYTDAKPGDRVVCAMLGRCGYCESCRKGLDSNCDNSQKPAKDVDVFGPSGLSEYILIEDYQLYKANNMVAYEELSLSEPLSSLDFDPFINHPVEASGYSFFQINFWILSQLALRFGNGTYDIFVQFRKHVDVLRIETNALEQRISA